MSAPRNTPPASGSSDPGASANRTQSALSRADRPSVPTPVVWQRHADGSALAQALSGTIAQQLRDAIERRGRATLAVSGGTTPQRFFRILSHAELAWERVTVTLVDERWVPAAHERSNARLVRTHLLNHAAAAARFVPLYRDTSTPESALPQIEADLAGLLPLDAAVLGMGSDGHTASFFPGGDRLEAALDPQGTARVLPMYAADVPEARVTLTLPSLASTRHLHLHFEGDAKLAVFTSGLHTESPSLPIHRVLQTLTAPLTVWWSP